MRSDPKMLYGVSSDFMGKILNGDPDQINKTLLEYNDEMIEYCKRSIQPTMIINQELNKLKLVCSDQLLPKINQYKALANDFVDEFQIVMNNISSSKEMASLILLCLMRIVAIDLLSFNVCLCASSYSSIVSYNLQKSV